jgi:hypothetical protein
VPQKNMFLRNELKGGTTVRSGLRVHNRQQSRASQATANYMALHETLSISPKCRQDDTPVSRRNFSQQ